MIQLTFLWRGRIRWNSVSAYIAVGRGVKKILIVSCVFCFGVFVGNLSAQEFLHQHFTTANGLAGNKVYSVCQDSKGYIWMATDRGAVRWNGLEFKRYSIDDGLPDNEALHIFEDAAGRIWVLCFGKKPACIENGQVNHRLVAELTAGFRTTDLYDYNFLNEKNEHWFAFKNDSGLFLIVRPGTTERYLVQMPETQESFLINDVVKHADGSVEFHLPGFLIYLRPNSRVPEMIPLVLPGGIKFQILHKRLKFSYRNHHFTISKEGYLVEYSFQQQKPMLHQYKKLPIEARKYFFKDGKPFFYNNEGKVYDLLEGTFVSGYSFLAGKEAHELYHDRMGNLWVATFNDGVYLYPVHRLPFAKSDLFKDAITHLHFGNKHLFGTEYHGLYVLDEQLRLLRHFPELSRPVRLRLAGNTCLIASDQGLFVLDAALSLRRVGQFRILKDVHWHRGDTAFVATHRFAFRVSLSTGKTDTLYRGRTTSIWSSPNGQVWIGGLAGVHTPGSAVVRASGMADSLLRLARVADITGDAYGRVFIATNNYGLFAWQSGRLEQVSTSTPSISADRQLTRLYYDGLYLWVLGHSGLRRIQMPQRGYKPLAIRQYGAAHGLKSCIYYDINGTTQAGIPELLTDRGLVLVNQQEPPPDPELAAEIYGLSRQGAFIPLGRWQELNPEENDLTIHYNAIAVLSDHPLVYEYRIPSLDSQWITTNANQVIFNDLKPGQYFFQVRVRSGNQVSFPVGASFFIKPSWFQHPVIQLLLSVVGLMGFLMLLVLLFKRSAQKIKRANEESQKLAELELQALRSRMNPHFVFNVLTAIQNFIMQGREQEANYYTAQFAQLIRQTFHGSASNFVSLAEEIQLLNSYLDLERMRFGNSLDYRLEVDAALAVEHISIPSMLIQPFLENAINHGIRSLNKKEGTLFVRIKQTGKTRMRIEVEDNGIGILASQRNKKTHTRSMTHKSEGMSLTQNRIDLMNRCYRTNIHLSIQDLSLTGGRGTLVCIDLPIQQRFEGTANQKLK
ncbi:MAG: hypothetical protein RLZZ370_394 [Bacteroidota bacterium]